MKTHRFNLLSWEYTTDESANFLDIDWPVVQKSLGQDHLSWLLKQPKTHCQLVLDKSGSNVKLVAEFYDEKTLTTYHLMWAK
jgi:hypothetical protein